MYKGNMEQRRAMLLERAIRVDEYLRETTRTYLGSVVLNRVRKLYYFGLPYAKFVALGFRGGVRPKAVKTFWGRSFLVPFSRESGIYYFGNLGNEEHPSIAFLIKHLRPDDIFYDIGAHCGFYSLLAGELVTRGQVHAFEPAPSTFYYLEKNLAGVAGTYARNVAVCDVSSTVTFYEGEIEESGSSTLVADIAREHSGFTEITVPGTTLDRYAREHAAPSVIKVDAEGAEAAIISGGRAVLQESSPVLLMEVWRGDRGARFSKRAVDELSRLGYRMYRIDRVGNIYPISWEEVVRDTKYTLGANFVFQK